MSHINCLCHTGEGIQDLTKQKLKRMRQLGPKSLKFEVSGTLFDLFLSVVSQCFDAQLSHKRGLWDSTGSSGVRQSSPKQIRANFVHQTLLANYWTNIFG